MKDLPLPNESWLLSPTHLLWLHEQGQSLVNFAKASHVADGFAGLDRLGSLALNAQAQTIHTARMVHSFSLAHLQGIPGCASLIYHGLAALAGPLRDNRYRGWFSSAQAQEAHRRKDAYLHAFVTLAASSAVVAGRVGAAELLADAVGAIEEHFWSEDEGALMESFAENWSDSEA